MLKLCMGGLSGLVDLTQPMGLWRRSLGRIYLGSCVPAAGRIVEIVAGV